jgi:hypothetical protein
VGTEIFDSKKLSRIFFLPRAVTQTSNSTEPSEKNYKEPPSPPPPSLITSFPYNREKKVREARKGADLTCCWFIKQNKKFCLNKDGAWLQGLCPGCCKTNPL